MVLEAEKAKVRHCKVRVSPLYNKSLVMQPVLGEWEGMRERRKAICESSTCHPVNPTKSRLPTLPSWGLNPSRSLGGYKPYSSHSTSPSQPLSTTWVTEKQLLSLFSWVEMEAQRCKAHILSLQQNTQPNPNVSKFILFFSTISHLLWLNS